jgi:ABC-type Na+ efflux pump permease subunit
VAAGGISMALGGYLSRQILTVAVTAGGGVLAYFALVHVFGLEEVWLLGGIVRRRLGR